MALPRSRRPSIRGVIALCLSVILVVTGLLVFKTYTTVRQTDATHAELVSTANQTILLEDIRAEYLNEWLVLLSARGPFDDRFVERFEQARNRVDTAFGALKQNANALGPTERSRVDEMAFAHASLTESWTPVITLIVQGRVPEAEAIVRNGLLPSSDAFVDQLAGEVERQRIDLNSALISSQVSRKDWETSAVLIGTLWVAVLIVAGYGSQRALLRPLGAVAKATRLIAAGEAAALAPVDGPAEIAGLAMDVNLMAASLMHRSKELNDYLSKDLEARTAELEAANEALRSSEEKYRELFENANDIVYTHELDGRFISMNKAGQVASGYSEAELLTMSIGGILNPEQRESSRQMFQRKLDGEAVRTAYEVEIIAKDGHAVPLEVSTRLIYQNGEPVAVQGIARDTSERRKAENELRRRAADLETLFDQLTAIHSELAESQYALQEKSKLLEAALEAERQQSRLDPLTGALNHGGIVAVLREVASAGAEATVFMVDIDNMKAANDIYGHPFGDGVLRSVKEALSVDGAVVGRYGGDEFIAVLKGAGQNQAEEYRRDVLKSVAEMGLKDPEAGGDVHVEVSVGFALYPKDGQRVDDLISVADGAMYSAKRERPSLTSPRRMGGDRAVRLVGEIVPVLTAPGDPRGRLGFVCERLAADCGYDGVELLINPSRTPGRDLVVAYPPMAPELLEQWARSRQDYNGPLRALLERTRRPIIVKRPEDDDRLAPFQRETLKAGGLQSVMIAPLIWEDRLIGSISVASKQAEAFGPSEAQVLMGFSSQVSSILSMSTLVDELRGQAAAFGTSRRESVRLLATIVEAQSGVLSHDMDRLHQLADALARRLGFLHYESEEVGLATMLHDIGKYRIPADILGQPQDLTDDEFEVVKEHTLWGSRILQGIPSFELAGQVARWHHERWDGNGYPDGLAGDQIPLKVAIASVADALDAMIYNRVYRQGMSPDAALDQVVAGSGSHFNPRVVEALVQLHGEGGLTLAIKGESGRVAA